MALTLPIFDQLSDDSLVAFMLALLLVSIFCFLI